MQSTRFGELKVASIQMVATSNIKENLESAARLVRAARKEQAELVALPEYFYLMGEKETDKILLQEELGHGPIQDYLSALAKENGVYLVAGTIPLKTHDCKKIFNSTLVFSPEGRQISRYDKIHLFDFQTDSESYQESATVEAGSRLVTLVVELNGHEWRFGLSVCYDLRFPELYRALGAVDCHVLPAAFDHITGKDHWEVLLRARAIENQCYLLASAQGGKHVNQYHSWGNSMLIDPWGTILTNLPKGEGVIFGTLYKNTLDGVRLKLPALKHRKL